MAKKSKPQIHEVISRIRKLPKKQYNKFWKLSELFNEVFEGLHDMQDMFSPTIYGKLSDEDYDVLFDFLYAGAKELDEGLERLNDGKWRIEEALDKIARIFGD